MGQILNEQNEEILPAFRAPIPALENRQKFYPKGWSVLWVEMSNASAWDDERYP